MAEALSDIEEVTDKLTDDLSGLHMEFDTDNLQLVLLDSDDQVIGTANLSTLAKDAMLEDVEIFTEAESGVSVSTPYLKFTFNTDAGTQPIRVPLTDFVINVTTDTVLSPVSTNPVQNKVIYEAIQALQTAINNITGTPDAALSPTSIKPVQNRVITNELNGVKDRVAALEGSGINYKYFKQVENLDTYQAEDGEIVEYIGSTNSKYTHGYVYERDTSKDVPAGSLIIHINTEESYNYNEDGTEKTITIPKQDFITEDSGTFSFYSLTVTRRINSSYTHSGIINSVLDLSQAVSGLTVLVSFQSTLTGQILINLTYENGEWKDENNYTYTINNSTKRTHPIYYLKGEINKRIMYETSDYYWVEGLSFDGGFTTLIIDFTNNPTIETISEAIIFWQQTDVQPQTDTSSIESDIAALQTDKANEVTSFTEAATRTNIASGDTVTTILGKIKKWFSDLKAVAFSGSYNDLTDKLQNATTSAAGLMSAEDKESALHLKSIAGAVTITSAAGWYKICSFSNTWGTASIFDIYLSGSWSNTNVGALKLSMIHNGSNHKIDYSYKGDYIKKVRLTSTAVGGYNALVDVELYVEYSSGGIKINNNIVIVGSFSEATLYNFSDINTNNQVVTNSEQTITSLS